ncbi:MAG: PTS sugar transporter subunit IIA [Spirochaetota bacterium]|nr:PTS sugar transporter subunit IIA [Spirochaetota bacterium]
MKAIIEFTEEKFFKRLECNNKFDAIEELANLFQDTKVCSDIDDLINALKEREEIMSTGIGFGLAIPHAKIKAVNELSFAIGVSKEGIDFNSMDGKPVHLVILVAAGEKQHKEYLKLLSNIMSLLKNEDIRKKIINYDSVEDIFKLFKENK